MPEYNKVTQIYGKTLRMLHNQENCQLDLLGKVSYKRCYNKLSTIYYGQRISEQAQWKENYVYRSSKTTV